MSLNRDSPKRRPPSGLLTALGLIGLVGFVIVATFVVTSELR